MSYTARVVLIAQMTRLESLYSGHPLGMAFWLLYGGGCCEGFYTGVKLNRDQGYIADGCCRGVAIKRGFTACSWFSQSIWLHVLIIMFIVQSSTREAVVWFPPLLSIFHSLCPSLFHLFKTQGEAILLPSAPTPTIHPCFTPHHSHTITLSQQHTGHCVAYFVCI